MEYIRPLFKERLHNIHRTRNRVAYFPFTLIFFVSIYFQRLYLTPDWLLLSQVALVVSGLLCRLLVYEKFFDEWKKDVLWVRVLNIAGFSMLSLAWGLHFKDIYQSYGASSTNVSYTLMLMVGYITAATNTLTASRESYFAFILPITLSVIGCNIFLGDSVNIPSILIILTFIFFSVSSYKVLYKQLFDLLLTQINSDLEKDRLKSLINTVPGFAGIFNPSGVCILANETTLKLYPDIIGRKIGNLDPTSTWEKFVIDFFLSDKKFAVSEHTTTITGQEVHALMNVQKMENGSVIVVSIINTELVQARNKIRAQEAQSQYTAKLVSLGEMAAGIAHEVNNPLTIILGSANIMKKVIDQDPVDKELVKKMADKIVETSGRISKTIKSMKSLSRNAENDPMTVVSLGKIFDMGLDVCWPHFRSHGVKLILGPELQEIEILGREIQISQVIMNLLNNAVDAIKNQDEKWVEVKAQKSSDYVDIFILDSGPGIPKELQKKIMEPFFTTKDVNEGTGLGLSISKKIMLEHGGDLKLLPDRATTTFLIRIRRPS